MHDKHCLWCFRSTVNQGPSVSGATVRARSPTVSSHPTGLNDVKHDFIIPSLSETVMTE